MAIMQVFDRDDAPLMAAVSDTYRDPERMHVIVINDGRGGEVQMYCRSLAAVETLALTLQREVARLRSDAAQRCAIHGTLLGAHQQCPVELEWATAPDGAA